MKRILVFWCATLISVLPFAAYGQGSDEEPNFRNAQWYDTLDEVKESETAKFVEHRTQEMNIAVDPPKPWRTEHLYYEDSLLGERVLILYRFDLDCKQLYEAGYIFDRILDDHSLGRLIEAIQEKHGVALSIFAPNDGFFASGRLNESTSVQVNRDGLMHFHTNRTVVYFQTTNFHWLDGWSEGTAPTCPEKARQLQELKEKI